MFKPKDPRLLAIALLSRSTCRVKVAAVLADRHGIFSWGFNNSGRDGFGEHAEAAALRRANPRRTRASTLYIASQRARNGRAVMSRPCSACQQLIRAAGCRALWRDLDGSWKGL